IMTLLSHNKLAVALVGILIAAGAWYVFSDSPQTNTLLSSDADLVESEAEKGIVETLLTLRAVSLSGTIFSDTAFGALKDFGTQIVQEPVGRPNPFAPRGAATTTGSSGSQVITPKKP